MADEAAGGADGGPSATAGGVVFVLSFPGELRAGRSIACAVAHWMTDAFIVDSAFRIFEILQAEGFTRDEIRDALRSISPYAANVMQRWFDAFDEIENVFSDMEWTSELAA